MAAVTSKQVHTLITQFLNNFDNRYGKKPMNFNRNRDKWGFQSMIEDLGMDRAKEVIDYYFTTNRYGHPSSYLLLNYDKVNQRMIEREEDEKNIKELLAESQKRVEEWRAEHGK